MRDEAACRAVMSGSMESKPHVATKATADQALLAHYKERVESFESERSELLNSIDLIKVQHEETHRMRWELRAREDEVSGHVNCGSLGQHHMSRFYADSRTSAGTL